VIIRDRVSGAALRITPHVTLARASSNSRRPIEGQAIQQIVIKFGVKT
jgi:hypothetical protein